MRHKWTEEKLEYIRVNQETFSCEQLAAHFGISESTLSRIIKRHELKSANRLLFEQYARDIGYRNVNAINNIGDHRFGNCVAESLAPPSPNHIVCWSCRCDCGQVFVREAYVLVRSHKYGYIQSCGKCRYCSRANVLVYGQIPSSVWHRWCRDATSRGIAWDWTPEQAWTRFVLQKKRCNKTGECLTMPKNLRDSCATASPDRIDSAGHYIDSNMQWVHKDINMLKGVFADMLFEYWCCRVSDHVRQSESQLHTA